MTGFLTERHLTQMTTPFTLGRCLERWIEAVQMEAAVTIVAEEQYMLEQGE